MSARKAFVVSSALVVAMLGTAPSAHAQADVMTKRGKMLWTNRGCGACHGIGKKMAGPDLAGLEQRRSREWINKWLKETDSMIASDSTAMALVAEWKGIRMPQQTITDQDVESLLNYLRAEEDRLAKK